MTAQRLPLPDWRDSTRGLPIAAITADGIKPLPQTIVEIEDEFAANAIEARDKFVRTQTARPRRAA